MVSGDLTNNMINPMTPPIIPGTHECVTMPNDWSEIHTSASDKIENPHQSTAAEMQRGYGRREEDDHVS